MPPLHLRQEFPTLKAFKEALHAWAIESHFEPRILKSDTGRVRVGCKRDPNCDFVVRCNWERKSGREPLARVTVLRAGHTCVNGLPGWSSQGVVQSNNNVGMGMMGGMVNMGNGGMNGMVPTQHHPSVPLEIRQDEDGNIVGGARVLGPINPRGSVQQQNEPPNGLIPAQGLPKVQRNSASRLPFLMETLPRLMNITKETTPVDIRECLMREFGAEVHLQQCRRAKTEILKGRSEGGDGGQQNGMEQVQVPSNQTQQQQQQQVQQHHQQQQDMRTQSGGQSMDGMGSDTNDHANMFAEMNTTSSDNSHPYQLHASSAVVTPQMPTRNASNAGGDQPVKCPYCINLRWMKSIKDAVDHMSMHVVV